MKRIFFVLLCAATLIAEPVLGAPDSAAEQLRAAIGADIPDEVRRLLEAGADVNSLNAELSSPLGNFARIGGAWSEEVLRLMLGGDADLDVRDALQKRFELYSECKPMAIGVALGNYSDEAVQGLIEEDIQAAIESRLRAARLYDCAANSYLLFHVYLMDTSAGWAYNTDVSFNKFVRDEASGQRRLASTWERGGYWHSL